MNKKIIVLVLAFLVVFAVSGCIKKSKEETTPVGAFVGGTSGIGLSFMANAPASEYPECTPFDVNVQVENKGEAKLADKAVAVTLGGISGKGYGISSMTRNVGELAERKKLGKDLTPGGRDIATFSSVSGSPDFPGDTTQTLIATACYPYYTTAMSTVCIKESFAKQTTGGTELCKVTGDKTVFNAGAPVQVGSLTQFPTGSPITGMTVNMKLKDVGGGTALATDAKCPSPLQTQIDKIKVTKMHLINLDLDSVDCKDKVISITGGEGFLSCKFDWKGQEISGEFEDILEMRFDYKYTQTATTKVKFLNIPDQVCTKAAAGGTAGAECTSDEDCPPNSQCVSGKCVGGM